MLTRKKFIYRGAVISTTFLGLKRITLAESATLKSTSPSMPFFIGYGPLIPDPAQVFDLPKRFRYNVIAQTGELMDDSFKLPGAPDGTAAFPTNNGRSGRGYSNQKQNIKISTVLFGLIHFYVNNDRDTLSVRMSSIEG